MQIWFASAEAAPFIKTGGLGDVAGILPQELKKIGLDVTVVLPYYQGIPENFRQQTTNDGHFRVSIGWRKKDCQLRKYTDEGVTYYFIDNKDYFNRPNVYGYEDDNERFAFFTQAVLEMMNHLQTFPNVLHCNDWHTAMGPFLLKQKAGERSDFKSIKTILTIHNLQFQGISNKNALFDLFGFQLTEELQEQMVHNEKLNWMKSGINYADAVSTVSPTYAKEIMTKEYGHGLEQVLQNNQEKVVGILNGLDTELYNPETNPSLLFHYSVHQLETKKKNKAALQKQLNLNQSEKTFVLGMVTRLTEQKGVQLLDTIFPELMKQDIQLIILGTGDPTLEEMTEEAEIRFPEKVRSIIDFDTDLAQQIYSGADLFLMPSLFEPCGLAQMNAMRYGTLPLVHRTGGLADTVEPYDQMSGKGSGFLFSPFLPEHFFNTIQLAFEVYQEEPNHWKQMMKQAMEKDFSWRASSVKYKELYEEV